MERSMWRLGSISKFDMAIMALDKILLFYFIIEYCRWRIDIKPKLDPKESGLIGNTRLGQAPSYVEVQQSDAYRPSVPVGKLP